jgi:hypothetical protein
MELHETQVQVEVSLVLFIFSDYGIFLGMKYNETFPFITQTTYSMERDSEGIFNKIPRM